MLKRISNVCYVYIIYNEYMCDVETFDFASPTHVEFPQTSTAFRVSARQCDVAIVGGGVMGASTALHLAAAGSTSFASLLHVFTEKTQTQHKQNPVQIDRQIDAWIDGIDG